MENKKILIFEVLVCNNIFWKRVMVKVKGIWMSVYGINLGKILEYILIVWGVI